MDNATLFLLPLAFLAFYLLIIRPQSKRRKEHLQMQSELEPGTRVMTIGGLVGTLTRKGDRFLGLELAPGVEITIDRNAVARRVEPAEEAASADTATAAGAAVDADTSEPPQNPELSEGGSVRDVTSAFRPPSTNAAADDLASSVAADPTGSSAAAVVPPASVTRDESDFPPTGSSLRPDEANSTTTEKPASRKDD